jgi:hypothetical protein
MGDIPFNQRLWCSVAEASQVLGICRTRVFVEISSGAILSKKDGSRRLCSVPSILERFEIEKREAAEIRQTFDPILGKQSSVTRPLLSTPPSSELSTTGTQAQAPFPAHPPLNSSVRHRKHPRI